MVKAKNQTIGRKKQAKRPGVDDIRAFFLCKFCKRKIQPNIRGFKLEISAMTDYIKKRVENRNQPIILKELKNGQLQISRSGEYPGSFCQSC